MANLESIRLPIDYSDYPKAVAQANTLENTIKKLSLAVDQGRISNDQYNKGLLQVKRQYEDLFGSSQKAVASVRGFSKALIESKQALLEEKAAQEALNTARQKAETGYALAMQRYKEEQTAIQTQIKLDQQLTAQKEKIASSYQQLNSSLNPLYKNSMKYADGLKTIEAAQKAGVISDQQAGLAAEQLAAKYLMVGRSVEASSVRMIGSFKLNRIGMMELQAAVVNTFQALAAGMTLERVAIMEGSQVMGAFIQGTKGLLGKLKRLGGWFVGFLGPVGLAVAGVSALGLAIYGLTEYFNRNSDEAKKAASDLKEYNAQITNITASLEKFKNEQKALAMGMSVPQMFLKEQLDKAKQELAAVQTDLAKTTLSVSGRGLGGFMLNDPTERLKKQEAKAQEQVYELQQKIDTISKKILVDQSRKNDLLATELKYGRDSVQYQQQKNIFERIALYDKQTEAGVSTDLIQKELAALAKQQGLQSQLRRDMEKKAQDAKDLATSLKYASEALSSMTSDIKGLNISNVGKAAELAALKSGKDKQMARAMGDIASKRASLAPAFNSGNGVFRASAAQELSKYKEEILKGAVLDKQIADLTRHKSKSLTIREDPVQKLQRQVDLQEKYLGVTQAVQKVEEAASRTRHTYGPEYLKNLAAQIQKQQDLKAISDTVHNSMESNIMALVDGTKSVKEAFRSMASDIIKQLYKIYVEQQLVNSVIGIGQSIFGFRTTGFTALSGASALLGGGAIGGGGGTVTSLFPSFDGGGYTGGGPRSGGIDGKGGFPAILHPQERVVDHTKGQSSGGMVVNQHFSFNLSANGDASVKQIIAESVPQITEAAKAAVVQAKMRGEGPFRSAFG